MNKKICFFCVGTGGHVLPVKNLLLELENLGVSPNDMYVISDSRGVQYLENLNTNIYITNPYVSKYGILGYIFNFPKIIKSIYEIKRFLKNQNINVVLTTGAYIAPVAAVISLLLNAKFFIQEQNVYAGLGNKISATFANSVFTSFEETKNISKKKLIYTGPIVNTTLTRKDISLLENQTIGFIGGSQGSNQINNYVYKFMETEHHLNFNIVHVTGKNNDKLEIKSKNYRSIDFIEEMDDFYKEINILVGRAGGGSLEAAYLGIPQILIPYKHGTTSSHQVLNAKYLEERGFGFTVSSFEEMITNIKNISENIKNKKINLENIPIGNLTISEELYEQIN
jgi:UDP-N-acetylglucosamine--N-acetylmuramyl-(pentapeptide) pyrophosphoryl-undecaprenol N-acetylglucosamine transferase